jgi:hypothetical protein
VAAVAKLSAQEKGSYKPLEWSYWQSEPAKYEMTVQSNSELSNQNVLV